MSGLELIRMFQAEQLQHDFGFEHAFEIALQQRLDVGVIDGVGAAVKLAEGRVALGLSTSTQGDYATPISKNDVGLTAPFSPR